MHAHSLAHTHITPARALRDFGTHHLHAPVVGGVEAAGTVVEQLTIYGIEDIGVCV